jgi:hypothetical protein
VKTLHQLVADFFETRVLYQLDGEEHPGSAWAAVEQRIPIKAFLNLVVAFVEVGSDKLKETATGERR